jgi:hypothetical protein
VTFFAAGGVHVPSMIERSFSSGQYMHGPSLLLYKSFLRYDPASSSSKKYARVEAQPAGA